MNSPFEEVQLEKIVFQYLGCNCVALTGYLDN